MPLQRRVVRSVDRVVVRHLSQEQREHLADQLAVIGERALAGDYMTRQGLLSRDLGDPDAVIGLLRGPEGELAGFVTVRMMQVEHEGERCTVFSAGVYVDLEYRGGSAAARFGLLEALRFKLRHPNRRLAYMSLASTPAPYLLHLRVMRQVFPRRDVETPAVIEGWMQAAARTRGLEFTRPGVVNLSMRPRDPSKFESSGLLDDPDAAYYVERNRNWHGDEALLLWVPLDVANVLGSLPRAMA